MYNKRNLKYIEDEDLYFSLIKGNGIYCWNNINDHDPTEISANKTCPVFMDVETEEEFLVKGIYWNKFINQYTQNIQFSSQVENVFWPTDLVALHGTQVTDNFVENVFGLHVDESEDGEIRNHVLLFPYKNYDISKTVEDELHDTKMINWKEPRVKKIINEIVKAYQRLNSQGYLCMDFDFSHLYIRNDKSILFLYSNLLVRNPEGVEPLHMLERNSLEKGEYPQEFAEPALIQGKVKYPDMDMQNYSLAAMLFYLMIGRYAYEGPLLAGVTDNNEVEHAHRFEVYHKNPVFIFDPDDTSNHLGEFSSDQKVIALWEELPKRIQNLFIRALTQKNAERRRRVCNPTPEEWIECLKELG